MDAPNTSVKKAVVPAAGLGTRFLPATKATPKEMLPVVDKPAIQYVVEEAAAAGFSDILMVTGRNKRPLEDHFDRNYELEETLRRKGNRKKLDSITASSRLAGIHYVRQGDPRGLGHAVLCAEAHIGREPFAVLLGDDLIDPRDPLLNRMVSVYEQRGGSVVALMEVASDQIGLYGCAAVKRTVEDDTVLITDLVEKPPPGEAPSNLAVIGRYLLAPEIFEVLHRTPPGRGDEIQLTDALRELAVSDGAGPVHGVVFSGRRYDTGDRADYLKSIVQIACEHEDLGEGFREWLEEFTSHGMRRGVHDG